MSRLYFLFFLGLCCFPGISCHKAGLDGGTTLVVSVQHHTVVIPNHVNYPDSVFVKFNATEAPSDPTHDYDAVFAGIPGEDHVTISNLHTGKYFLFAAAMDSAGPYRVVGGLALKIVHKDKSATKDVAIAVTE